MSKSTVQGCPSKRAPTRDPYSSHDVQASVAACTPRSPRRPERTPSVMAARWASDHGVSPIVKSASTPPPANAAGSTSGTAATGTASSDAKPASSDSATAAWGRTPWTPAGPCGYGDTSVTMNNGGGLTAVDGSDLGPGGLLR